MMNTRELKKYIIGIIDKSYYFRELEKIFDKQYYFTSKIGVPGIYIYNEKNKYNYISVGDRGKIEEEISVDDKEIIVEKILWNISSTLSTKLACCSNDDNFRKVMFEIRLKILGEFGESYKEYGKNKIEDIIAMYPYS